MKRPRESSSPVATGEPLISIPDDEDPEIPPNLCRYVASIVQEQISIAVQPHLELIEKLQKTILEKDERIRQLENELASLSPGATNQHSAAPVPVLKVQPRDLMNWNNAADYGAFGCLVLKVII